MLSGYYISINFCSENKNLIMYQNLMEVEMKRKWTIMIRTNSYDKCESLFEILSQILLNQTFYENLSSKCAFSSAYLDELGL